MWSQGCLFCGWTGIDQENSYPAEGPTYYSMGEPGHIEPCICQYAFLVERELKRLYGKD